ncbi:hypothetical protein OUZ56_014172 [Daphnia magna]|uniref:Secreted protein n=1 Tax=Daphnia magna TaxID=35525 RepID=A0ABQ9Z809_9CRUS|nr:hypothetical protein OUZ56_014172 [Daphnia magna]
MHLYWLLCTIFCIFALECHGQQFYAREEPVKPCGGKGSNQVDAVFKGDYFACKERAGTLIKNVSVRIDLQDAVGGFERNGKRWRNLQLQQNGPRRPGYPSTVATVLIECNKTFPIRLVRKAFVDSMSKCAMIWLSQ